MHDAAGLEFRDLRIRHARLGPQRSNAQSRQCCKLPRQVCDGPAPQGPESRVPDRRRLVVVAVWAECLSDPEVPVGVALKAPSRDTVLAFTSIPEGSTPQHALATNHPTMDRAKRR